MTVKAFIDLLYTCDFDAEVYVSLDDGYFKARKLVKEVRSETSLDDTSQVENHRRVIIL